MTGAPTGWSWRVANSAATDDNSAQPPHCWQTDRPEIVAMLTILDLLEAAPDVGCELVLRRPVHLRHRVVVRGRRRHHCAAPHRESEGVGPVRAALRLQLLP